MLIRYAHKTSILINKNDYGSCCNVATYYIHTYLGLGSKYVHLESYRLIQANIFQRGKNLVIFLLLTLLYLSELIFLKLLSYPFQLLCENVNKIKKTQLGNNCSYNISYL